MAFIRKNKVDVNVYFSNKTHFMLYNIGNK